MLLIKSIIRRSCFVLDFPLSCCVIVAILHLRCPCNISLSCSVSTQLNEQLNCPQLHYHSPLHNRHTNFTSPYFSLPLAAVLLRPSLFWDVTQSCLVFFCHRRFGIQAWPLRMGPRSCPEISVTIKLRSVAPDKRRPQILPSFLNQENRTKIILVINQLNAQILVL